MSAKDRDVFMQQIWLSPERVLVIENSVDPHYFAFSERSPDPVPRVVFVGALSYMPNRQAARGDSCVTSCRWYAGSARTHA